MKILVPIDGSEQADKALDKAVDIAKKEGESGIMILHVVERNPLVFGSYPYVNRPLSWIGGYPGYIYPSNFPVWAKRYDENKLEYSKDYFTQVVEQLKLSEGDNIDISYKVVPGKPAEKILEQVEEEDIDLIVMGSTGLGSIGKFLLGGTSSRVKANADVPVKIINEDGEEVEAEGGLLT